MHNRAYLFNEISVTPVTGNESQAPRSILGPTPVSSHSFQELVKCTFVRILIVATRCELVFFKKNDSFFFSCCTEGI